MRSAQDNTKTEYNATRCKRNAENKFLFGSQFSSLPFSVLCGNRKRNFFLFIIRLGSVVNERGSEKLEEEKNLLHNFE